MLVTRDEWCQQDDADRRRLAAPGHTAPVKAVSGLLIPKCTRHFTGFDGKVVALYSRSITMREIQGFLAPRHVVEVSPEFMGDVTDTVVVEVNA